MTSLLTKIDIPADLRPAGSGLPEAFTIERNADALGGVVVRQRTGEEWSLCSGPMLALVGVLDRMITPNRDLGGRGFSLRVAELQAEVEQLTDDRGRLADNLERLLRGVDRFFSAYGLHLNEPWRAHLEELTGERRFFGMRDAGRPASKMDPAKACAMTDADRVAAGLWRKEQS